MNRTQLIQVAYGKQKAECVIKDSRYLNVYTGEILRGDIAIEKGVIAGIGSFEGVKTYYTDGLIVPGFIDGHVHIESSMTTPRNFAALALSHGTTTAVCDPHEIANVAGIYGIKFMLDDAESAAMDLKFMLPSCVPATEIDENYGQLSSADLAPLMRKKSVLGLAEVMNVPAVLSGESDMLKKIDRALNSNKVVDGHAPMLSGKALDAYISAGITSDHECVSEAEALEKLRKGQYIMIRQGTAAQNLPELVKLIDRYHNRCMLVTDDLHPEDMIEGHIDKIVREAIALGADPVKTIISASFTPATRFKLDDRGAIAPGKRADLAVLDENYFVRDVFCAKRIVGRGAEWNFPNMNALPIKKNDLMNVSDDVIGLVPHQLLTRRETEGRVKLFCMERHHGTGHKAACYLGGYGIKRGAVATSIAHDSHNIIAAGFDEDIVTAVNELIKIGGGIVVACGNKVESLPLEIGGIMTSLSADRVAKKLISVKNFAYELGVSKDIDPFMTLSFLGLPVIPLLRLLPSGVVEV